MYDTLMLKNLETKFQSAALAELLADPKCMLGLGSSLKTWRVVDEMLRAEKAAYDEQYKKRLEQFEVMVPSVTLERTGINWLLVGTICGIGGLIAYKLFKGASKATPVGAGLSLIETAQTMAGKQKEKKREKEEREKEEKEEGQETESTGRKNEHTRKHIRQSNKRTDHAGRFKISIEGVA